MPRESRFEEHARRGKTTAKTIFNGSAAVKADASMVREAVAVTVVTLIAPRGVEFIEHRIHKAMLPRYVRPDGVVQCCSRGDCTTPTGKIWARYFLHPPEQSRVGK